MNIKKYINRSVCGLTVLLAAGFLWGCSAESFDAPDHNISEEFKDAQIVLEVPVPKGDPLSVVDTRAGSQRPDDSDPNANELKINDFHIFIFKSGQTDPVVSKDLSDPALASSGKTSALYPINGLDKNGEYTIYLIANFGQDRNDFSKVSSPKEIAGNSLKAGNLPMVYKSNPISLSATELGPVALTAKLEYACAKVKYKIIFDKTKEDVVSAFGSNFMTPGKMTFSNVSKKLGMMKYENKADASGEDNTTSFELAADTHKIYPTYSEKTEGQYVNDDKITVSGNTITAAEAGAANTWVLQGTVYLPERYVTDPANMTAITLDSKVGGSDVKHTKTLGTTHEGKELKRGNYYEVIGRVKETGINGVDWVINVLKWEDITIDVDFVHTYLTLDTTETYLTSEENGEINYETDGRGNIGFESFMYTPENSEEEIPLFELASPVTEQNHKLVIRVNSDVTIKDDTNLSWTEFEEKYPNGVPCYIVAGNIRKEIYVKYEIGPIFEITPSSIKIQEGDGVSDDQHIFEYRTNLGGFNLESISDENFEFNNNSKTNAVEHILGNESDKTKITLQVIEGSASRGKIQVKVVNFAKTTVVHSFNAKSPSGKTTIPLTVEVMPKKGNYRIYFRAINDYQASDNLEFLHGLSELPKEDYSTNTESENWIDYWDKDNRTNKFANQIAHRLYAYTQYGEEANSQPVWKYTADYAKMGEDDKFKYSDSDSRNNNLIADYNNPGWYYYDIPEKCKGEYYKPDDASEPSQTIIDKYSHGPLPGATLLIFYSQENDGISRHRVNQEDEPGIPLGDDNDMETWVLFDPSRDPVYTVYNNKPRIENVRFTVYSDTPFDQWRNNYGIRNIHKTLNSNGTSNGYPYSYTIDLKAAQGEYSKSIYLGTKDCAVICVGLHSFSDDGRKEWGIPIAHFYDKVNKEVYLEMTRINDKEFYIVVPEEYKGKYLKFLSNNRSKELHNGKEYTVQNTNSVKMTWSDNANLEDKNDYSYLAFKPVTLMFGGRSWTSGYYKGGKWSETPQ